MATLARRIPTAIVLLLICYFSFIHTRESINRQEKVLHRENIKFQCKSEGFYSDPNDCSVFYRCLDWGELSENSVQSRFTLFKFQCTIGSVFDQETNSCIHSNEATRLECRHNFSEPLLINYMKAEALQTDYNSNNQLDYGVLAPEESNQPPPQPAYAKPSTDAQLQLTNEVDNTIAKQPPRLTSPPCNTDGFFPIPNDCTHFYRCVSSDRGFNKYEFSCSKGTVWDPDNNACNHAWAVKRQNCQNVSQDPGAGSAGSNTINPSVNVEGDRSQGNNDGYPHQQGNSSQGSGQFSSGYPNQVIQIDGYPNQQYHNKNNGYPTQSNTGGGNGYSPLVYPNGGSGYPNQPGINQNPDPEQNLSSNPDSEDESSELIPNNNGNGSSQTIGEQGNQNGSSVIKNSTCLEEGFHPEPSDCKKFYRCVKINGVYTKFDFECAEGTVWDTTLLTCNYPYAVEQSGCQSNQDNQSPTTSLESNTPNGFGTSNNQQTTASDDTSSYGLNQQGSFTSSFHQSSTNNQHSTSTSSQQISSTSSQQTSFTTSHSSSSTSSNSQSTSSTSQQSSTTIAESSSNSNQQTGTTSSSQNNSNSNQDITSSGQSSLNSNQQTGITSSGQNSSNSNQQTGITSSGQNNSNSNQQTGTTFSGQSSLNYNQQVGNTSSGQISSNCNQQVITTSSSQSSSNSNQQSGSTFSGNQPSSGNQNSNKVVDQCIEEGFLPSSTNCNKFYWCVKNELHEYIKYEFNCGPGTVFDPAFNVCNHPSAAKNEKCKNSGEGGIPTDGSTTPPAGSETSSTPSTSSNSSPIKPSNNATITTELGSNSITTTMHSSNAPTADQPTGKPNKNTTAIAIPATSKLPPNKPESTASISNNNATTSLPPYNSSTMKRPSNTSSKPPKSTTRPVGSTKPNNQTSASSTIPTNSETVVNTTELSCQNSTKPGNNITCNMAGFYPHPDNCKKFYRCVDWDGGKGEYFSVYHFDCPEGTIFDPNLDTCNHEASVYPPRNCSDSGNATTETKNPTSSDGTSPEVTSTPGDNTSTLMSETTTTSSTSGASTEHQTGETSTHRVGTSIIGGTDMTTVPSDETTLGSANPQTSVPTELSTNSMNPIVSATVSNTSNTEESTIDSNQFATTLSYMTTNNLSTNKPTTDNSTTIAESSTPTNVKCPEIGPDQFNLVCPTGFRRHPKYCNLFYQCTTSPSNEIKVVSLSCPYGTHYDQTKSQCLPPDQAQKCEGSTMDTRTLRQMANSVTPIPVKAEESICPNEGSFEYKDDCRHFFRCIKDNDGKLNGFLYQCPEGFTYWIISKQCEKTAKVPCDSGKKLTGKPSLAPIEHKDVGTK